MGRGRRSAAIVAVIQVTVLTITACAPATLTSRPAEGSPGATGPCGVVRRDVPNPIDGRLAVSLFEPVGEGRPATGGSCADAARPVVLVAHGYLGMFPEVYEGLLRHLAGQGHVVVFSPYQVDYDPPAQYGQAWSGFRAGVAASGRADPRRVGVVGHSFGAGMAPWLLQQAVGEGWGGSGTWLVMFAPHFAQLVGSGPIVVPESTRALVVAYELDSFVDARIGIEILGALTLNDEHREHVMVRADRSGTPARSATHLGPISFESLPVPIAELTTDDEDIWVAWRSVDVVSRCALAGLDCEADLAAVGRWPDGREAVRPLVGDQPVDRGPVALQECEFVLNPRPCP